MLNAEYVIEKSSGTFENRRCAQGSGYFHALTAFHGRLWQKQTAGSVIVQAVLLP
ncbi:MAG: hypothetical protein V2I97_07210 [Desulfococcaceae bacterium]|jgi:hypothetical protein|nr:hypothetical protein [Desulfococcaceae bacterium]